MFLATCSIIEHYWEKSRLNSQYSQPVPVSVPIFSTFPYLTDASVLNHISSPALHWSQVVLVLGTPEMGTALQKFFSSAEKTTSLNLLTAFFIKQPKILWAYFAMRMQCQLMINLLSNWPVKSRCLWMSKFLAGNIFHLSLGDLKKYRCSVLTGVYFFYVQSD